MKYLNRSVMVIKPKSPFVEWINRTVDVGDPVDIKELQEDCTAYLVSEAVEIKDMQRFLKTHYKKIFEYELWSWSTDPTTWPSNRTFKMFCEWLQPEVHSEIMDTCNEPLAYEDFEESREISPEDVSGVQIPQRHEKSISSKKIISVQSQEIYQLKITLLGFQPFIWRRIQVIGNTSLRTLHKIFQTVMGWSDYHLHLFRVEHLEYGEPDPEYNPQLRDDKTIMLREVIRMPTQRFYYQYDFGDNWEHDVVVEKIFPFDSGREYPVCLAGKRACPPEDCGGTSSYRNFLKILKNPKHPEYEETFEWLGIKFDPQKFELEKVNAKLRKFGNSKQKSAR